MEKLYTTIYAFFFTQLGLKGLAKEVFAILFGFWMDANQSAAWVSLTTMGKITGGSRPAIVAAVKHLESVGLVKVERSPGKHSMYTVIIKDEILNDYMETFGARVKPANSPPVSTLNRSQYRNFNTTCQRGEQENNKKADKEGKINSVLRTRKKTEFILDGLREL